MAAKKPITPSNNDCITDALNRAQALAHVLADAAGGDLGVEAENVHQVCLMIAKQVKLAQDLLGQEA